MIGNGGKRAKATAITALVVLVALLAPGTLSAVTPETGSIGFILKYEDVKTGDAGFVYDSTVSLMKHDGTLIETQHFTSPSVSFDGLEYGGYIVKVDSFQAGNYLYRGVTFEVRLDASGDGVTNVTLDRYTLEYSVNLTVNYSGQPAYLVGNFMLEAYTSFGLMFASVPVTNETVTITAPEDSIMVKVLWNQGGTNKEYYATLDITSSVNVSIDLANYDHFYGIVVDENGNDIQTTTRVTLLTSAGDVWRTFVFPAGLFDIYVENISQYRAVITADGYDIVEFPAGAGYYMITLPEVEHAVNVRMEFSDNFTAMTLTETIEVDNTTILPGLPYDDVGVLYYQIRELGYTAADLQRYYENSVPYYTTEFLKVAGDIYALDSVTVTVPAIDYNGFTVTITATYTTDASVGDDFFLELMGPADTVAGAKINYTYEFVLPDDYQRANDPANAEIDGWAPSVFVHDFSGSVQIEVKKKAAPEILLSSSALSLYWDGINTTRNYVINETTDNFTVIVPADRDVFINASNMVRDVVRDVFDPYNTTYVWKLDGGAEKSGYNVSYNLAAGVHTLNLTATDAGGSVAYANITLYADGTAPSAVINITATTLTLNLSIEGNTVNYDINGTAQTPITASGEVRVPDTLIINESEDVTYRADETKDTLDGTTPGGEYTVEWSFGSEKSTQPVTTYTFDRPTRGDVVYITVTLSDLVDNSITINFTVTVRDATPPTVNVKVTDESGKEITRYEVDEGGSLTFDASDSEDPEDGKISTYYWYVEDSDGNPLDTSLYTFLNSTPSDPMVTIQFEKYGLYYVVVNVTDDSGNTATKKMSVRVSPLRPDLTITNVEWDGNFTEWETKEVKVNVSNNGRAPATEFHIVLLVDGEEKGNWTFYNLPNGTERQYVLNITLDPGEHKLVFKVVCDEEPADLYATDNVYKTLTVKVQENPMKWAAIVIVIILAIAGVVYYFYKRSTKPRAQFSKKTKKKEKEEKPEKKRGLLRKGKGESEE